jgi:hypothetical protein
MTTANPTDAEIAAAPDLLICAGTANAEAPKATMIELVTMPEFGPVLEAVRKAQTFNPADSEVPIPLDARAPSRVPYAGLVPDHVMHEYRVRLRIL